MFGVALVLALQSVVPNGYSTQITVQSTGQGCRANFILTDGSVGYSAELPTSGIAGAFDELMSGNMDADAEVNIEPLQRWGKRHAQAIESACARSGANNGASVVAVR